MLEQKREKIPIPTVMLSPFPKSQLIFLLLCVYLSTVNIRSFTCNISALTYLQLSLDPALAALPVTRLCRVVL